MKSKRVLTIKNTIHLSPILKIRNTLKHFLLFLLILTAFAANAQSNLKNASNRIGIQGQYALLDLNTSNFHTNQEAGFLAGLSKRSAFYNNFDLIFGVDFMQTSLSINANGAAAEVEKVKYTWSGAQVKMLLSYLIAGDHFSVEFGPIFQVNGKMELDNENQRALILDGYTSLQAEDIQEWSRVNGLVTLGLSAGFTHVRFTANYQYGFTNALKRLNDERLELKDPAATNFKGNLGLITAGIVLYL